FPLEIVLHQRVGAAGIGGRDLHESMVARPIIVRPATRRHETVSLHVLAPMTARRRGPYRPIQLAAAIQAAMIACRVRSHRPQSGYAMRPAINQACKGGRS